MRIPRSRRLAKNTEKSEYVPNELLSRLVGMRLYSVEFVVNDYLRLGFDPETRLDETPILQCDVWPLIERAGRTWFEQDLGYADMLRSLAPGIVSNTVEQVGVGIRIELDSGTLVFHPTKDEVSVEIAMLNGFADGEWMVWRPGEDSFEDLA